MASRLVSSGRGKRRVAPRIAHQIFHTAFLPAGMDIGEEGFEAVHAAKMAEGVLFQAPMPFQHLRDRRFEVVVDHHARHPTPELEGVALA